MLVPKLSLSGGSFRSTRTDATAASQPRSPKSPRRPRLGPKKSSGILSLTAHVRSAFNVVTPKAATKSRPSSSDGARALEHDINAERKLLLQKQKNENINTSNSAFFKASRWHQATLSTAHETMRSESSISTLSDDLSPEELFNKAFFAMRFVELYGLEPAFEKPRDTRPRDVLNIPQVDVRWLREHEHDAREVLNVIGSFFAKPWQRVCTETEIKAKTKTKINECGFLKKGNRAEFGEELVKVRHFLASDDVRRILIQPPDEVTKQVKQLREARGEVKKYEERIQEKLTSQEEKERFESYRQWTIEFERSIQQRWSSDPPR